MSEDDSTEKTSEERLEALREFDLTPVTKRVEHRKDVPEEKAQELENKFKRFVKATVEYPEKTISPSPELDEYWHAFILDTVRYHEFCDRVLGRYMHHVPGNPTERNFEGYEESVKEDTIIEDGAEPYIHE